MRSCVCGGRYTARAQRCMRARPVLAAVLSVLAGGESAASLAVPAFAPSRQLPTPGASCTRAMSPRMRFVAGNRPTISMDMGTCEPDPVDTHLQAVNRDPAWPTRWWRRGELLLRSITVFWTAFRLFADYKLVQWRTNQMAEEQEDKSEALWEAAHARNAAFLFRQFVALEGLWVKLGQFLSSRADVMPAQYVEILSACQDSLPARPFEHVQALVEQELGRPLNALFESFEECPIACASIAQVHRAVLKNGQEVVVKVQHDTVGKRLLQDLENLETIGNIVKRLEPDFDFSPVIREWARSIPNELDFREEERNLQRVTRALASRRPARNPSGDGNWTASSGNAAGRAGGGAADTSSLAVDVALPQAIQGLSSRKVLVMSFVDGFKVAATRVRRYGTMPPISAAASALLRVGSC